MNLQLPISFYSSLLFINEAVFISEQITECKFRVLLGISDTFSSKLNVFSYMILHNHTPWFWKQWQGCFA